MARIVLNIAGFVALMTFGATAGVAFSHALEWPNTLRLDAEKLVRERARAARALLYSFTALVAATLRRIPAI